MSCANYKDQILKFDHLSSAEQDQLLDHIEECETCQTAFDNYLTLEEALDSVLQDETIDLFTMKRQSIKYTWQRALLICASLLLLCVGAWYTPPVKAVIEKALNFLMLEQFSDMRENIEGLDSDPDGDYVRVVYGIEMNKEGEKITSYISGNNIRTEYPNGNFSISNGEHLATYTKEENIFFIEKTDREYSEKIEKDQFKDMDPNQIKTLGEKKFLNRWVEVYQIHFDNGYEYEFWFDKETNILLREILLSEDQRIERSKMVEFKIIEVKKDHTLFDLTPPNGARVLER